MARHTFRLLCGRFLRDRCPKRGIEPATRKMYEYFTRDFLVPALGDRIADELTHLDFEALYNDMLARGFDPSTISKAHTTASGILRHAEREGWVSSNVARLAEPPRRRPKELTVPSPEDVQKFTALAATMDLGLAQWARVASCTGMRPGEVCALQPGDLNGTMLTISRAIDICEGPARVKGTKTGKVRRLTVDAATADILRERTGTWTFEGDAPWRQDSTAHRFRTISRLIGVRITPRMMRHFHATQLLASGKLSARQVADRLGGSGSVWDVAESLRRLERAIQLDELAGDFFLSGLASQLTACGLVDTPQVKPTKRQDGPTDRTPKPQVPVKGAHERCG